MNKAFYQSGRWTHMVLCDHSDHLVFRGGALPEENVIQGYGCLDDLIKAGWVRRGGKWYCPEHNEVLIGRRVGL